MRDRTWLPPTTRLIRRRCGTPTPICAGATRATSPLTHGRLSWECTGAPARASAIAGASVPRPQASHRRELATGRDLREGQGLAEIFVSGHKAGATVDLLLTVKAGPQSHVAVSAQGDRSAWLRQRSRSTTVARTRRRYEIRQIKYLNNIVEHAHRAVKRATRPMLGFKSFRSAAATLTGIELMHTLCKGQLGTTSELRPAQQFYALAG